MASPHVTADGRIAYLASMDEEKIYRTLVVMLGQVVTLYLSRGADQANLSLSGRLHHVQPMPGHGVRCVLTSGTHQRTVRLTSSDRWAVLTPLPCELNLVEIRENKASPAASL